MKLTTSVEPLVGVIFIDGVNGIAIGVIICGAINWFLVWMAKSTEQES